MEENVVFVRVGWMQSYQASLTGEPAPIGGGKYTKTNVGWEKDNFLVDSAGRAYGYFAVGSGTSSIGLYRIDGVSRRSLIQSVQDVLVIFVAPHPIREDVEGPLIVGWYRHATIFRDEQPSSDGESSYRVETTAVNVECVPVLQRRVSIPSATRKTNGTSRRMQGIGQSNIYYIREPDGSRRKLPWLKGVLTYVDEYKRPADLEPEVSAEISAERKAGFQSDARIRKAVEKRAMAVVASHYKLFTLKDTSKSHPYDYAYMDGRVKRYIEVKGTQVKGTQGGLPSIILTPNEVGFARERCKQMELCLVHSIVVDGNPNPRATGGVLVQFPDWNPDEHRLEPIQYICTPKRPDRVLN